MGKLTDFEIREILRLRTINPSLEDLSISTQERLYVEDGALDKFWYSRMKKRDPIARIGYSLWAKEFKDVEKALAEMGGQYSDIQNAFPVENFADNAIGDTYYWKTLMANSTIVNLYVGILRSDFEGDHAARMARIKEIGIAIAKAHIKYVTRDIKKNYGKVPGLLSLEQLADYHHEVFRDFRLTEDNYGGTFSSWLPDKIELMTYGHLYCRDCDSDDGYDYKGKNRW